MRVRVILYFYSKRFKPWRDFNLEDIFRVKIGRFSSMPGGSIHRCLAFILLGTRLAMQVG